MNDSGLINSLNCLSMVAVHPVFSYLAINYLSICNMFYIYITCTEIILMSLVVYVWIVFAHGILVDLYYLFPFSWFSLHHSFSFFFFNFYFYFILLYSTVLILPYIDMNLPRVYMSSQPWTPFHLPSPTPYHLSGSSPCTSPKHPVSWIEHRLAIHFLHDR